MERPVCPLCRRWISEWQEQTGKTMPPINGRIVHVSCALEANLSVAELVERFK